MSLIAKRPTKVRNIKLAPGLSKATAKENVFSVVVKTNTLKDLRQIAFGLVNEATADQIAKGNPPNRVTVDGKDDKPPTQMKREIKVLFGTTIARELIDALERELIANIRAINYLPNWMLKNNKDDMRGWKSEVGNINNWQWYYIPPEYAKGEPAREINPRQMASFPPLAKLMLKPKSTNKAGMASKAPPVNPTRQSSTGEGKPVRASSRKGYLAKTTHAIKRKRFAKDFTIWAGYTSRNPVAGEQWIPDWMTDANARLQGAKITPYIIISAKSKRTGSKGYMSEARRVKLQLSGAKKASEKGYK